MSNDMRFLATATMVITGDIVFDKKVLCCWDELGGLNSNFHCKKENCAHINWTWNDKGGLQNILRQDQFNERILTYFCPKPKTISETILNVKMLTGKKIEVLVDQSCSVLTMKEKIQDTEGIPPNQQRLVSSGVAWEDWRAISDYKIENNTVHCVFKLGPRIDNAFLLDKEMF